MGLINYTFFPYKEMPGAHEWKMWDAPIQHFITWALRKTVA